MVCRLVATGHEDTPLWRLRAGWLAGKPVCFVHMPTAPFHWPPGSPRALWGCRDRRAPPARVSLRARRRSGTHMHMCACTQDKRRPGGWGHMHTGISLRPLQMQPPHPPGTPASSSLYLCAVHLASRPGDPMVPSVASKPA